MLAVYDRRTYYAADGTASAPSFSFASDATSGFYRPGANQVGLTLAGSPAVLLSTSIPRYRILELGICGANGNLSSPDAIVTADAANTLALRNGTNAQSFRLYNTYTDSSNYERLSLGWSSNVLTIKADSAGTGTGRSIRIDAGSSGEIQLTSNGNSASGWKMDSSRNWIAVADNTQDIGQPSANRPRHYFGAGDISLGATGAFYWVNRSAIRSPADGVVYLANNANNDFGRLCFGGTTSSFPALKRFNASIQARLADDSGNATVIGSGFRADSDPSGLAGHVTYSGSENTGTSRSTGVGSIKFADATARDNAGFIKIYIGTTAYYIPVFAAN